MTKRLWMLCLMLVMCVIVRMVSADEGGVPQDLEECLMQLDDALADLEACESQPPAGIVFPGDGVMGEPLSYTDNGDGTVTDDNTQLVWLKKTSDAGVHHKDNVYTYAAAEQWIADRNAENHLGGGWRLPTRLELMSILNYSGVPVVPTAVFGTQALATAYHWSSTPAPNSSTVRQVVDFRLGGSPTALATNSYRVIAVR